MSASLGGLGLVQSPIDVPLMLQRSFPVDSSTKQASSMKYIYIFSALFITPDMLVFYQSTKLISQKILLGYVLLL